MGGSLWRCISANVWGLPADLSKDARVHTSVSIIRSELLDYYKELKLDNPDLNLTEIQDLVPTMLGKEDAPALNLKGLETRHALPYVVSLVGRHQGLLGACNWWSSPCCWVGARGVPRGALGQWPRGCRSRHSTIARTCEKLYDMFHRRWHCDET